jgi:small nuclear ribonucleoprotein E
MTGRGGGGGGRRVLLPPINFIFKLLQSHATVQIWLYEQLAIRIEGKIRVRYITNSMAVGLWSMYAY